MKIKIVLMILITLAMVFTMAGAVSAEDVAYNETSENGKTTDVKFNDFDNESYTIIIPLTIYLNEQPDGTVNGTLKVNVTKVVFNMSGWTTKTVGGSNTVWNNYTILNISVDSSNAWNIIMDTAINKPINVPYTANITKMDNTFTLDSETDSYKTMISDGARLYIHGRTLISQAAISGYYSLPAVADIELKVTDPSKLTASGEYKDTLTFNVQFEDIINAYQ